MIDKIINILNNADKILIISHKNPDGDTIGSNFALHHSLKIAGKKVVSYCDNNIPFEFLFLKNKYINFTSNIDEIKKTNYNIAVFVDCGDINRTEYYKIFNNLVKTTINIDHHITNTNFANINLVDSNASATGEIIYNILKNGNFPINKTIATSLYTAILTDTGSFRYSNTTVKTFKIASELMEFGINSWEVAEKVYESKPVKRIYLLKEALNNLKLLKNNKIALTYLNNFVLKKYGATAEDTDGIVNIGRSISGVEFSIFIREEEDGCKLSFRSKGNLDISVIAVKLGGGGHKNAAGAFLKEPLNSVLTKLEKIINEYKI